MCFFLDPYFFIGVGRILNFEEGDIVMKFFWRVVIFLFDVMGVIRLDSGHG